MLANFMCKQDVRRAQDDAALRWLALTAHVAGDRFDSVGGFICICQWELATLKWLQVCVPMSIFDFLFGGLR